MPNIAISVTEGKVTAEWYVRDFPGFCGGGICYYYNVSGIDRQWRYIPLNKKDVNHITDVVLNVMYEDACNEHQRFIVLATPDFDGSVGEIEVAVRNGFMNPYVKWGLSLQGIAKAARKRYPGTVSKSIVARNFNHPNDVCIYTIAVPDEVYDKYWEERNHEED